MDRDAVLDALRQLQPELRRQFSVRSAGVFGSVARGDDGPESDIDVLIEFDPHSRVDLFDYMNLKRYVAVLLKRRFRRKVDVIDIKGLDKYVRPSVERDVVYAF